MQYDEWPVYCSPEMGSIVQSGAVYILKNAVCSVLCSVCSVQYAVYSMQCAVCSVQYAVCSMQCAVCSVQYAGCRKPIQNWLIA